MLPAHGALRLARVGLFALVAVALASGAHLAAGSPVSAKIALSSIPAVMLVVNRLADRRRGARSLLLGTGLTQVALHVAFMIAAMRPGCQLNVSTDALVAGLPMTLAHALASIGLALVLAHGEAALWTLASHLGFRITRPETAVLPSPRRLPLVRRTVVVTTSRLHRLSVRRRGPPMAACVIA
jgi:hypothetical protein